MAAKPIPLPRKAEKKRVKLKLGLQGASGSGKTEGALSLARNIWPEAKICLVDSENESASLYADRFEFDTIPLEPPYTSERYEACIEAAVQGGYDVLILDTISHQWDGDGGILRRKEELDQRPNANSYTNWAKFTPEHQAFIEAIKQAPIHVIATMRSKQDYVLSENDRGKKVPVKVGMAPVQRDGVDYEFSIVFDIQVDHRAAVSKDRTGLFDGKTVNLKDTKVSDAIRDWLMSGKEVVPIDHAMWSAKKSDENTVNLALRIESQSENERTYFWLCKNGQPCILYVAKEANETGYKRLIDQVGKDVSIKAYPRGDKDGKPKYELAMVVKVEAINPVTNIPAEFSDFTTTTGPARFEGDYLLGVVTSIDTKLDKNKKEYRVIQHSLRDGSKNVYINSFHKSLDQAVADCKGRFAVLKVKLSGAYLNLEDVMSIDGVAYENGKILEA